LIKTEWDIQDELTARWIKDGGAICNQKKLFFVAREVMSPSWLINDKNNKWNEPSIDFVFIDANGEIWLIEIKRTIKTPRDAWSVLCQVSHRAVQLQKSYSFAKLRSAYLSTQGNGNPHKSDLLEEHKIHFDLSNPISIDVIQDGPFRRVVAANSIAENFSDIKSHFSNSNIVELQKHIRENYNIANSREFERFLEISESEWKSVSSFPPEEWLLEDN
jgi:hypothetical protein